MIGTHATGHGHTYTSDRPIHGHDHEVTTTIIDGGGSTATTSCTLLNGAVTVGGSFVIGDLHAAIGDAVTFWGPSGRS
jgi:hypothetical protein